MSLSHLLSPQPLHNTHHDPEPSTTTTTIRPSTHPPTHASPPTPQYYVAHDCSSAPKIGFAPIDGCVSDTVCSGSIEGVRSADLRAAGFLSFLGILSLVVVFLSWRRRGSAAGSAVGSVVGSAVGSVVGGGYLKVASSDPSTESTTEQVGVTTVYGA